VSPRAAAPDGGGDAPVEVRAAGGVVWRRSGDGTVEVALVHRPRYDDWSLPKGKAEPDERDEDCALREVREETGLDCRLGRELPTVRYVDHKGRTKQVRYWAMQPRGGRFEANDEVDELVWLPAAMARPRLTYDHDQHLLDTFET